MDVENKMELEENLITAWIHLTGALKCTRITQGMIYNEAIVMLLAYNRYKKDGVGLISFKEIVAETGMFKSLVNRTLDTLEAKGYLVRCVGEDKRTTLVRLCPEKINTFLKVHDKTLDLVQNILSVVGEEDAETFVRISEKVWSANPLRAPAPKEDVNE